MQYGVREIPGRYDSLDYENDNDNDVTSIPLRTCLTYW